MWVKLHIKGYLVLKTTIECIKIDGKDFLGFSNTLAKSKSYGVVCYYCRWLFNYICCPSAYLAYAQHPWAEVSTTWHNRSDNPLLYTDFVSTCETRSIFSSSTKINHFNVWHYVVFKYEIVECQSV